jgi:hypothetical protein
MVEEFIDRFTDKPNPPSDYISNVGGEVRKMKAGGGRAGVWYDEAADVYWMLGFTPNHNYKVFEQRAANQGGKWRPGLEDFTQLELERTEPVWFEDAVAPGLRTLVCDAAFAMPGTALRGRVGRALSVEAIAHVERIDGESVADVKILLRLPLNEAGVEFEDWPGTGLLPALAGLIDPHATWGVASTGVDGSPLVFTEWVGLEMFSVDVGRLRPDGEDV